MNTLEKNASAPVQIRSVGKRILENGALAGLDRGVTMTLAHRRQVQRLLAPETPNIIELVSMCELQQPYTLHVTTQSVRELKPRAKILRELQEKYDLRLAGDGAAALQREINGTHGAHAKVIATATLPQRKSVEAQEVEMKLPAWAEKLSSALERFRSDTEEHGEAKSIPLFLSAESIEQAEDGNARKKHLQNLLENFRSHLVFIPEGPDMRGRSSKELAQHIPEADRGPNRIYLIGDGWEFMRTSPSKPTIAPWQKEQKEKIQRIVEQAKYFRALSNIEEESKPDPATEEKPRSGIVGKFLQRFGWKRSA